MMIHMRRKLYWNDRYVSNLYGDDDNDTYDDKKKKKMMMIHMRRKLYL